VPSRKEVCGGVPSIIRLCILSILKEVCVGFNDEEEIDVFDLNAGSSKSDEYRNETNVFSVEFDVPEIKRAEPVQAALPAAPVPTPAPVQADDDDEFDFSSGGSPASIDDDDEDFPEENEGFFSKIKGMFAKPDVDSDIDDVDVDDDTDLDTDSDFSDDDDIPAEGGGFFAKIKGIFAKPDADDVDMDDDVDADIDDVDTDSDDDMELDAGSDFSDDDDLPAENGGFFSKVKGIFAKPADIDDFDDDLPGDDDDDYTPVLDKVGDSGVFEMSSSAAPQAEPEFEAAEEDFDIAEREFETVQVEIETFESKSQPVVQEAEQSDDDEFDLSVSVPPPAPAPLPPPVFSRIAHVCLRVKNLDASIDFYTKLGFTKRFAFNKNGALFGVYLEFGKGNFIEIFKDTARRNTGAAGRLAHFCLETPDIDAVMKSLSSRGIEYTPKKLGTDSTYQIWLKDPDGNEFEIHQYTPESSQFTGKNVEADW